MTLSFRALACVVCLGAAAAIEAAAALSSTPRPGPGRGRAGRSFPGYIQVQGPGTPPAGSLGASRVGAAPLGIPQPGVLQPGAFRSDAPQLGLPSNPASPSTVEPLRAGAIPVLEKLGARAGPAAAGLGGLGASEGGPLSFSQAFDGAAGAPAQPLAGPPASGPSAREEAEANVADMRRVAVLLGESGRFPDDKDKEDLLRMAGTVDAVRSGSKPALGDRVEAVTFIYEGLSDLGETGAARMVEAMVEKAMRRGKVKPEERERVTAEVMALARGIAGRMEGWEKAMLLQEGDPGLYAFFRSARLVAGYLDQGGKIRSGETDKILAIPSLIAAPRKGIPQERRELAEALALLSRGLASLDEFSAPRTWGEQVEKALRKKIIKPEQRGEVLAKILGHSAVMLGALETWEGALLSGGYLPQGRIIIVSMRRISGFQGGQKTFDARNFERMIETAGAVEAAAVGAPVDAELRARASEWIGEGLAYFSAQPEKLAEEIARLAVSRGLIPVEKAPEAKRDIQERIGAITGVLGEWKKLLP